MKTILVLIALTFTHVTAAFGERPREWTSVDGRKIQATLRTATATDVTLLLPNGQTMPVPLAKLSQADQDYVNQWQALTAKQALQFGIEVLGVKSETVSAFLQSKDASGAGSATFGGGRITKGGSLVGTGKALSRSVNGDGVSYSVEGDGADLLIQVRARMTPPKMGAAPQSLDVNNLSLVYITENKVEEKSIVRPRWLPSDKTKMATHKSFTLDNGKAIEFGVGFIIPARAVPTALFYKGQGGAGQVDLEVPLR